MNFTTDGKLEGNVSQVGTRTEKREDLPQSRRGNRERRKRKGKDTSCAEALRNSEKRDPSAAWPGVQEAHARQIRATPVGMTKFGLRAHDRSAVEYQRRPTLESLPYKLGRDDRAGLGEWDGG